MRKLLGKEEELAIKWMNEATSIAEKASCERAKCGSVIVKDDEIIGTGYNSPAHEDESQRRCLCDKNTLHRKVTDKTCCVHAEQRAIIDVLKNNPQKITGSSLYFVRLDDADKMIFSGKPYCTICSKMALDVGIKEFVLWHEDGIVAYETEEYNLMSYKYSD